MRLAIYYEVLHRNDGNPLYVTAALQRRAVPGVLECDHLRPESETVAHQGSYDAHLWVDWGEDALQHMIPYPIMECPKPMIYWASDTHINEEGFKYRLEMARKADHAFVAQKRAVEEFAAHGVKAEWLPHAFEPEAYHDRTNRDDQGRPQPFEFASKDFDVCFVGHVSSENRVDFLDHMFKAFPNFFWGQKTFQDAARVYAKSRIALNISMTDDVNMRCFEVTGSRTALLTNWLPTIEELGFKDGENCILYRTLDEAVEKTKFYLAHDAERERIAQAGYELAMSKHRIDQRVDRILEVINSFQKVEA